MNDQAPPVGPWPAVTYEPHEWELSHPLALSRTQRRKLDGPYLAAVVPEIAHRPAPVFDVDTRSDAEAAVAEIVRFDAELAHRLLPFTALLLRSESSASSKIENLTASAKAVALAEVGRGRSANAALVVRNTAAMEAAIRLADSLDAQAIIDVHATLLREDAPHLTGRFRSEQVWIGGSDFGPHTAAFVPPHHDRVEAAVEDLVRFTHRDDLGALVQIAIAHAQFETIHPFEDGNGRTGRALVHALLRARGLTRSVTVPLSAGLLTDTPAYFAALDRYREGDPAAIVAAFARAAFASAANGRRLVAQLDEVRAAWDERITARRDSIAWPITDLLFRQPAVDWGVLTGALDATTPALLRAIDRLVGAEVLVEATGAARNRVWIAPDILDALDRFAARAGRRVRG